MFSVTTVNTIDTITAAVAINIALTNPCDSIKYPINSPHSAALEARIKAVSEI
jgi:hypothetical protein